jgi:hypothetical protein
MRRSSPSSKTNGYLLTNGHCWKLLSMRWCSGRLGAVFGPRRTRRSRRLGFAGCSGSWQRQSAARRRKGALEFGIFENGTYGNAEFLAALLILAFVTLSGFDGICTNGTTERAGRNTALPPTQDCQVFAAHLLVAEVVGKLGECLEVHGRRSLIGQMYAQLCIHLHAHQIIFRRPSLAGPVGSHSGTRQP